MVSESDHDPKPHTEPSVALLALQVILTLAATALIDRPVPRMKPRRARMRGVRAPTVEPHTPRTPYMVRFIWCASRD